MPLPYTGALLASYNVQNVSFQYPPPTAVSITPCSAFTKELCQVRARDFDYFSTDFVRSVFVVYAHYAIGMSGARWMDLHGTSTFSTESEFPCKTP